MWYNSATHDYKQPIATVIYCYINSCFLFVFTSVIIKEISDCEYGKVRDTSIFSVGGDYSTVTIISVFIKKDKSSYLFKIY